MKEVFVTNSPEETLKIGKILGEKAREGDLIAIYGDLGTGKTTLSKGIALGLGISEDITSPTFSLMEIYKGQKTFYHFDLYRIENENELNNLFFEEYWGKDGISVIEWPERAHSRLPKERIEVFIEYINDFQRRITIEYPYN